MLHLRLNHPQSGALAQGNPMKKIGRNDPCPCGSGLKYKKCCLPHVNEVTPEPKKSTRDSIISDTIVKLQKCSVAKKKFFKIIGAFAFFSTSAGDAWLLELTEQDAVQVAKQGESRDVVINETEDTLEISWSHSFAQKSGNFMTTAYEDNHTEYCHDWPANRLRETISFLKRR